MDKHAGQRKGGKSKSSAKRRAARANVAKARRVLRQLIERGKETSK